MRLVSLTLIFCFVASQVSAADTKFTDAKKKFQEAVALAAGNDYESALRAFEASYALHPRPSTVFNVGMCLKELGRLAEALEKFEFFLSLPHDDSRADQVADAKSMVVVLEPEVGYFDIEGLPNGVEIRVDGRHVATTPLSGPLVIDAGRHSLEVGKENFETLHRALQVIKNTRRKLRIELVKSPSRLNVECDSPARVVIDGGNIYDCPLVLEIAPGRHDVVVSSLGMAPFEASIETAPGQEVRLQAKSLEPVDMIPKVRTSTVYKISAISSWSLAIASGIVGGYYTYQWKTNSDDVDEALMAANAEADNPDRDLYDQLQAEYVELEADYKANEGKYLAGSWIGFGLAGALSVTGAILWIVGKKKEQPSDAAPGVYPAVGGMTVTF